MKKEEIVEQIKDSIIRGKYRPGQKIVEAQLCRELGLGRSRIREALQQLEQEDFIQRAPHASPAVKGLSQMDISQILDVLGVLEGLSMRIATPFISEKNIHEIETLVEKIEKNEKNKFKMFHYNWKLHQLLTELGENTRLVSFANILRDQTRRMSLESFYNPEQVSSSLREHREILNAIRERNPIEVEELIRRHYMFSKDRLIKNFNRSL